MFPPQSPTSCLGQLETQIRELKSELSTKANSYDLRILSARMDSIELAIGQIRADFIVLGDTMQRWKEEGL
jgi:hypothetical protein